MTTKIKIKQSYYSKTINDDDDDAIDDIYLFLYFGRTYLIRMIYMLRK